MKHEHLIIRIETPQAIADEQVAIRWLRELIELIDMKILIGPFARYVDKEGNRGLTVGAIIETSHIVLHTWDEGTPHVMQLDVYSCSTVSPQQVMDFLHDTIEISKIEYKFLDRERGLIEL